MVSVVTLVSSHNRRLDGRVVAEDRNLMPRAFLMCGLLSGFVVKLIL